MGIISDIFDDIEKSIKVMQNDTPLLNRDSLAKKSRSGVLQFPVICSDNVSPDILNTVAGTLETNFSSFILTYCTMNNITDATTIANYIGRFHSNKLTSPRDLIFENNIISDIKIKDSFDICTFNHNEVKNINFFSSDMKKILEEYLEESGDIEDGVDIDELSSGIIEIDEYPSETVKMVVQRIRSQLPGNKIYRLTENNIILHGDGGIKNIILFVKENSLFYYLSPPCDLNVEYSNSRNNISLKESHMTSLLEYRDQFNLEILNDKFKPRNYEIVSENKGLVNRYSIVNENDVSSIDLKDSRSNSVQRTPLTSTDVKKYNAATPTMVHLKTYFKTDNGAIAQDYLIGVKANVHLVESPVMIDNLNRGIKRKSRIFNFIRWTTGEMSFLKDFVLNVPDIKSDIRNNKRNTRWLNVLKRRARFSKINNIFSSKQLLPNASIIITEDEAYILKRDYNIDLRKLSVLEKLMKEYFLISFTIIDTSSDIVHLYFDGDDDFKVYPVSSLTKEYQNRNKDVLSLAQMIGKS